MLVGLLVSLIILQLSPWVFCNYQCTMKSLTVSCSDLSDVDLMGNTTAIINKTDISSLNILDGNIPSISSALVRDFQNVQTLHIQNSRVTSVDRDAFVELSSLFQELSLSGNALTSFSFECFSPTNGLKILDLSSNLLEDLTDFNASYFQQLQVLNLSNNFLTYLPVGILNRLKEVEKFYLLIDNNPWDCTDSNWSEHLTDDFIKAFCTENEFNYTPDTLVDDSEVTTDESVLDFTESSENLTKMDTGTKDNTTNCYKCSFYYCLLWLGVGTWIGIILGNIGKIKNLFCNKTPSYTDKHTQCEYSLVEQHMVSGIFDFKERKFVPSSVLGTPGSATCDKS